MNLLLDRGADIDVRHDYGRTPLCDAADERNMGMVQLLLDRGASVPVELFERDSPLIPAHRRDELRSRRLHPPFLHRSRMAVPLLVALDRLGLVPDLAREVVNEGWVNS